MKKLFQINHLARLSNIELNTKEISKYNQQIEEILNYVESLQKIKATSSFISQTTGLSNVWREDKVKPGLDIKAVLQNAQHTQSDYIKVKAVLKNKDT